MTEQSRTEFEQRLAELAAQSPEYREQLLRNPKECIENLLKTKLPGDLNVVMHEENENTLHFVLPQAGDELGAAEMAQVAGGGCWSNSWTMGNLDDSDGVSI